MNIIDAINDEELFKPFFGNDLKSWSNWFGALRALYGLPILKSDRKIIRQCTGRQKIKLLPKEGFREALFITGRRSGKSRIASVVGGFESVFGGHEKKLSPGEKGMIAVFSPTKYQSSIVYNYLRALFQTPILSEEVVHETKGQFVLRNGLTVSVITGDHKIARGFTLCCAIVDETAFFGVDENARVKSDTELIRGIKPGLATTKGRLICITSPWLKMGYVYKKYKQNIGNEKGRVLVWNCPSKSMNPTLDKSIIDDAIAEDPTGAKSEYLGEFREDAVMFCPRDFIEACVIPGRMKNCYDNSYQYVGFFDASGGRSDSATLGIAHEEGSKIVLDILKEWKPPHNPYTIVYEASYILKSWGLFSCIGDRYSAEFLTQAFLSNGIDYTNSQRSKSDLYLEFLPLVSARKVELLDNEKLVDQFSGLIRTTRSGGRDKVDHTPGNHDDLSNVTAGAIINACLPCGGRVGVI